MGFPRSGFLQVKLLNWFSKWNTFEVCPNHGRHFFESELHESWIFVSVALLFGFFPKMVSARSMDFAGLALGLVLIWRIRPVTLLRNVLVLSEELRPWIFGLDVGDFGAPF